MSLLSSLFGRGREPESDRPIAPNSSGSSQSDVESYYALLGQIRDWQSKRKFDRMLDCCARSLPLLPALVSETRREYGEFDISSRPAIEVGCRYWAAMGDATALSRVSDAVDAVPELKHGWAEVVKSAYADLELSAAILDHIHRHPGCLQNGMGQALGVSGRDAARVINTLENLAILSRARSGKTYELHVGPQYPTCAPS